MEAKNPTIEQQLEQSGAMMVNIASRLIIASPEDYERGGNILKDIKARQKAVKDYWKEPKKAAQDAHKTLVAREAAMLKPLEQAESAVKRVMLEYTAAQEKARREAEEAARREREAEAARLEALARQAEQDGDDETADVIRDLADMEPEAVTPAAPAAKGVSVRKSWKARVTDPKLVPAYFDHQEIRTINMAALNAIARYYNGDVQIPGVEIYEDATMSVRA